MLVTALDLSPYVTPAMLLATNYGISWNTFPKQGSSDADQVSAQLEICWAVTSTMDTMANQTLRADLDLEQEFGPDFTIAVQSNGWTRFRLSHWPILQLVGAQYSLAGSNPPSWTTIPPTALVTEHNALPAYGTIVPDAAGPGPTAALIAPGYVGWNNGRKGYYIQVSVISGFPVAGIDTAAAVGATSIHVDDITGWWNGTAGARGTIYDPPYREAVTCSGVTPDTVGAIAGPGTLALATPLQFAHNPIIGRANTPNQKVLLSAMPQALLQAGYYLATHYGLMRGATAAVMQSGTGQITMKGMSGAQDWYDRAEKVISHYARVF